MKLRQAKINKAQLDLQWDSDTDKFSYRTFLNSKIHHEGKSLESGVDLEPTVDYLELRLSPQSVALRRVEHWRLTNMVEERRDD